MACHTLKGLVNEEFVPKEIFRSKSLQRTCDSANVPQTKPRCGIGCLLNRGKKEEGTESVMRGDDWTKWLVDVFVMLAPDVERRHVTKSAGRDVESLYVGPFFSGIQHLVRKPVNVYSRFDTALQASNAEKSLREAASGMVSTVTLGLLDFRKRNPDYKWEKRLGEAPHPLSAPPNFASINATEIADRPIDHSDHIDSLRLARAIASELGIGPKDKARTDLGCH